MNLKNKAPWVLMATALSISGCSSPSVWVRPGATTYEFNRDKSQCTYESTAATQNTDYGYRTMLVQELDKAMRRNELFTLCMNAKGWSLQQEYANDPSLDVRQGNQKPGPVQTARESKQPAQPPKELVDKACVSMSKYARTVYEYKESVSEAEQRRRIVEKHSDKPAALALMNYAIDKAFSSESADFASQATLSRCLAVAPDLINKEVNKIKIDPITD